MLRRRAKGTPEQPFAGTDWGPVAWRGLPPGAAPWEQIGVYGDAVLSQYPARWEGPQLFNGVRGFRPGWEVASTSLRPIWQQTQRPSGAATGGGQRWGARYTGNQGAMALAAMAAAQVQAQVSGAVTNGASSAAEALAWIRQAQNMPNGST